MKKWGSLTFIKCLILGFVLEIPATTIGFRPLRTLMSRNRLKISFFSDSGHQTHPRSIGFIPSCSKWQLSSQYMLYVIVTLFAHYRCKISIFLPHSCTFVLFFPWKALKPYLFVRIFNQIHYLCQQIHWRWNGNPEQREQSQANNWIKQRAIWHR